MLIDKWRGPKASLHKAHFGSLVRVLERNLLESNHYRTIPPWHIASFRGAAEVSRYRRIADTEWDATPPCNCNRGFSRIEYPRYVRWRGPGTNSRAQKDPAPKGSKPDV